MDEIDHKEEGRRAFGQGLKALDVPYPDWARRALWVRGWYEAEHASRLTPPAGTAKTQR
jgi:hypothetical protein